MKHCFYALSCLLISSLLSCKKNDNNHSGNCDVNGSLPVSAMTIFSGSSSADTFTSLYNYNPDNLLNQIHTGSDVVQYSYPDAHTAVCTNYNGGQSSTIEVLTFDKSDRLISDVQYYGQDTISITTTTYKYDNNNQLDSAIKVTADKADYYQNPRIETLVYTWQSGNITREDYYSNMYSQPHGSYALFEYYPGTNGAQYFNLLVSLPLIHRRGSMAMPQNFMRKSAIYSAVNNSIQDSVIYVPSFDSSGRVTQVVQKTYDYVSNITPTIRSNTAAYTYRCK